MVTETEQPVTKKGHSGWKIAGLILLTVLLSVGITLWLVKVFLFPSQFEPVTLDAREEQVLEQKLSQLGARVEMSEGAAESGLQPEPYSEVGADREVFFSERELNAMLAKDPELARRAAIDLSQNLASLQLLIPLDPQFPLLGGQTLKVSSGVEMRFAEGRPVVILKGVSLWGVPLPNAWLGNMKNIDLVQEFGTEQGFWKAFADGVEEIEVQEGQLRIRLKE